MASAWAVMPLLTTNGQARQPVRFSASHARGRTVPNAGDTGMADAPMAGLKLTFDARQAVRATACLGLLVMLGANLPGHLSYDSVAQLYEGHFHVRETWGP